MSSSSSLTPALVPSLFSPQRWARFVRGMYPPELLAWAAMRQHLPEPYSQSIATEQEYRRDSHSRGGSLWGWRE